MSANLCRDECAAFYANPSVKTFGNVNDYKDASEGLSSCSSCLNWTSSEQFSRCNCPELVGTAPTDIDGWCAAVACKNQSDLEGDLCSGFEVALYGGQDPSRFASLCQGRLSSGPPRPKPQPPRPQPRPPAPAPGPRVICLKGMTKTIGI